jgi:hypothetical protein
VLAQRILIAKNRLPHTSRRNTPAYRQRSRLARVAHAVQIGVRLIGVRDDGAVVHDVRQRVAILIGAAQELFAGRGEIHESLIQGVQVLEQRGAISRVVSHDGSLCFGEQVPYQLLAALDASSWQHFAEARAAFDVELRGQELCA